MAKIPSIYASGGDLSQIPTESDIDTAYNRYIENLEKSASDLSDDEVMTDVMDSFVASKGLDPQSLVMPPPEKRRDLYKTLELAPPPASEATLDTGSLSWYRDHGLLAPPMAYEEFLRRRYNLEVPELLTGQRFEPDPGSGSTDKYLPAVIDAAAEVAGVGTDEPRPKATGKGQRFRGIGSLMRRRIFPLVQAVQLGYEHLLTDEQRAAVREFMESPAHELVGMEKSGLEYIRDYFGLGETEPEGEAIVLPEKMYQDFYHGTPNEWSSEAGYPVGRPRLDFMGTGEGTQVYSPGFYGGEARAVGYEYAEMLAKEHGKIPNVYKGEIREDIVNNKFIDFNLPVDEQSQDVQEVFKKLGYGTKNPNRFAGADILLQMKRRMGDDAAIAALREEGIVGLRYLDRFSRNNKNLYKGKSLVKKNGKALVLNEDWQQQGREVLQHLVDNNIGMDEFVRQQREVYGQKGKIPRVLGGARQHEKLMDILERTTVKKSPLTRNVVVWDQPLLDQIGKTIKKEMATGGLVVKPLYNDARII